MFDQKQKRETAYLAVDLILIILIFIAAIYFYQDFTLSKKDLIVLSVLTILWCLVEYLRKQHYSDLSLKWQKRILIHIKTYVTLIILEFAVLLYLPVPVIFWKQVITLTFGIFALDFLISFLIIDIISGDITTPKLVIVAGTGNKAKKIEDQVLTSHHHGYQLKGFINCGNEDACMVENNKLLSDLDNIDQYLQANPIDEIVIALPDNQINKIQQILAVADYHGIRVKYVLDYQELFGNRYKITRFGHIDAVNIRQLPIDGKMAGFFKNVFDKIFAVGALAFLIPLFLAIAIIIKMETRGPVFYSAIRIGKGGRPFRLYKFRSMRENDNSADGVCSTRLNDPRITRVGRILRKYSIDELPQFINVLLGHMSVVGPRPHRRYLNRQLQENVYHYMLRQYVKPGLTGWAQVNGWRGPTDTEEQKRQRTLHDLWYIENWSFALDIKIIFLTIFSPKVHKAAF
jgi:Undecaprenyl-phosphate glucose phosphotransferase